MAVEVMYPHHPKHIYRHGVPLIALGLVVMMFAAAVFVKYSSFETPGRPAAAHALVTPSLHVTTRSNGFASIRPNKPAPKTPQRIDDTAFNQAGKSTQTSLIIQSTADSVR